jgi:purine-cytosine permease-like protein
MTEHVVFKRGLSGYDVRIYTKQALLPPGYAALGAFAFGVAGAVLGMAQVWFVGPIGKQVGTAFGGDIGFELAFGFAAVSYLVLRTWEVRVFRR